MKDDNPNLLWSYRNGFTKRTICHNVKRGDWAFAWLNTTTAVLRQLCARVAWLRPILKVSRDIGSAVSLLQSISEMMFNSALKADRMLITTFVIQV